MKISFYIASKDYAMFIAGKEVELKTGNGWAGYIKVKEDHNKVQFKGEIVQRVMLYSHP